jgi:hypothetical protein
VAESGSAESLAFLLQPDVSAGAKVRRGRAEIPNAGRTAAFALAPLPSRPAAEALSVVQGAGLEGAAAAAPGATDDTAAPGATRNGCRARGQGTGRGGRCWCSTSCPRARAREQDSEGDALWGDCEGGPSLGQVASPTAGDQVWNAHNTKKTMSSTG